MMKKLRFVFTRPECVAVLYCTLFLHIGFRYASNKRQNERIDALEREVRQIKAEPTARVRVNGQGELEVTYERAGEEGELAGSDGRDVDAER